MNKNYVKEYKGHKVPEGAEYYNDLNGFFYNKDRFLCFDTRENSKSWAKTVFHRIASQAIELPEAPQEWMPAVGDECECFVWTNYNGGEYRWVELPVVGYAKFSKVKTISDRGGIIIDSQETQGKFIECITFRPLKTQQEKDREAFIDAVAGEFSDGDDPDMEYIASKLFDAGFAVPKAER